MASAHGWSRGLSLIGIASAAAPGTVAAGRRTVQLRSTAAPLAQPPTSSNPVNLTNPRPFDACEDIPYDVIAQPGLAFTPPKPVEGVRCELDAGNYQTSYGLIQQSLYYSPMYSNPDVDCPSENLMRAQQLAPHYKY